MPGLFLSPCQTCILDLPPLDINGDFTEVSNLISSEEERRETLSGVSNLSEWRHLQHLLVQVRHKGVTLARAMDRVDVASLPLYSPPTSPTQLEADEEYGGRYFGEDWDLYG